MKENILNCQKNVAKGLKHWENAAMWGEKCLAWVASHKTELEKHMQRFLNQSPSGSHAEIMKAWKNEREKHKKFIFQICEKLT